MIVSRDTSFHFPSSRRRAAPAPKDRLTSHYQPVRQGEDWLQGWKEPPPQSDRSGEGGPWAPRKEQPSPNVSGRVVTMTQWLPDHVAQPGTCLAFISVAGSSCRPSKFPLGGVTKIRFDRSQGRHRDRFQPLRHAKRPLPKGASLPRAYDLSLLHGMLLVQDLQRPSL